MTYDRLTIEEFGRHLLSSLDLDPIYVALVRMELTPEELGRWLLAYWCCYDAGVSSYIADADGEEFWGRMEVMARNEEPSPLGGRWRRAAERRHWRGKNALASLAALRDRYGDEPEDMAHYCANGWTNDRLAIYTPTATTCSEVMRRAREHTGFGPWIGFKIADMAERVMEVPVSFDQAEVFVFKDPAKAAQMAYEIHHKLESADGGVAPSVAVAWAVAHLTHEFCDLPAPPGWDRPVGLQEVETVLCKFKSHLNGHYPLYNDLAEIRHHALPWRQHSRLAGRFIDNLPEVPQ